MWRYCKKIIIFYLTLSLLSLISRLCLSSLSLHRWTQKPTPRQNSHPAPYHSNPKTETATRTTAKQPPANQHHRAQPTQHHITPSSSTKPTQRHHITNSRSTNHNHRARRNPPDYNHRAWQNPPDHNHRAWRNPYHEFAIHDPRSKTGAVQVRARHGANEVLGFIEA